MQEQDELVHTVEHLQGALEDLAARGLRSAGKEHLAKLSALREEFERVGADHLAGRIAELLDAAKAGDRSAAAALLRTQASLRVFERILTLRIVHASLRERNLLTVAFVGNGTIIPRREYFVKPNFHEPGVILGVSLFERIVAAEHLDGCFPVPVLSLLSPWPDR